MIFNVNDIEEKVMPNFMGGEKELRANIRIDELGKILASATLVPGASIGEHTHTDSSEIILLLSGKGTLIDDGESFPVEAGQVLYCPKGHTHSLINTSDEDLVFFAVVPKQ